MVVEDADKKLIRQFINEVYDNYLPALKELQKSEISKLIENTECLVKDPSIQNMIEVLDNIDCESYMDVFEVLINWIANDSTLFAYLFMLKHENATLEALILNEKYNPLSKYLVNNLYLCKKDWIRGEDKNENE